MNTRMVLVAVVLAVALSGGLHGQQPAGDEAGVRKLGDEFTAALNQGDGRTAAALFARDGDYISSTGRRARGRNDIEKMVNELAAGPFKGTTFKTAVTDVRFISPDVAIGNGTFESSGAAARKGMTTIVAVREGNAWRIAALRAMVPAPVTSGGSR